MRNRQLVNSSKISLTIGELNSWIYFPNNHMSINHRSCFPTHINHRLINQWSNFSTYILIISSFANT